MPVRLQGYTCTRTRTQTPTRTPTPDPDPTCMGAEGGFHNYRMADGWLAPQLHSYGTLCNVCIG